MTRMGLDKRDPEYQRDREMALILLDQNWRDGLIADAAFMCSLMMLGYLEKEARWHLSSMILDRSRMLAEGPEARRASKSREYVANRGRAT